MQNYVSIRKFHIFISKFLSNWTFRLWPWQVQIQLLTVSVCYRFFGIALSHYNSCSTLFPFLAPYSHSNLATRLLIRLEKNHRSRWFSRKTAHPHSQSKLKTLDRDPPRWTLSDPSALLFIIGHDEGGGFFLETSDDRVLVPTSCDIPTLEKLFRSTTSRIKKSSRLARHLAATPFRFLRTLPPLMTSPVRR